MKQARGIWLPASDTHMERLMEPDGSYQRETLIEAVDCVSGHRNAIDIGAHVGLWARHLVNEFRHVHAFEPVAVFRECFIRNMTGEEDNYTLYPVALGEEEKTVSMVIEADNTGHTHIGEVGEEVQMKRLDDFGLTDIDFIKMDCEGYELFVCMGGRETILRDRPIICLEQKPHGFYGIDKHAAVRLLAGWGMREIGRVRQDFIMGW